MEKEGGNIGIILNKKLVNSKIRKQPSPIKDQPWEYFFWGTYRAKKMGQVIQTHNILMLHVDKVSRQMLLQGPKYWALEVVVMATICMISKMVYVRTYLQLIEFRRNIRP